MIHLKPLSGLSVDLHLPLPIRPHIFLPLLMFYNFYCLQDILYKRTIDTKVNNTNPQKKPSLFLCQSASLWTQWCTELDLGFFHNFSYIHLTNCLKYCEGRIRSFGIYVLVIICTSLHVLSFKIVGYSAPLLPGCQICGSLESFLCFPVLMLALCALEELCVLQAHPWPLLGH